MNIGKSVRVALAQRGLKQKDLAEKLGVSTVTACHLANDKECSGSRLRSLADVFDLTVSEFVALGEDNGKS